LERSAHFVIHWSFNRISLSFGSEFLEVVNDLSLALILVSQGAIEGHVTLAASDTVTMKDLIEIHVGTPDLFLFIRSQFTFFNATWFIEIRANI
jgi:hypothetical protein